MRPVEVDLGVCPGRYYEADPLRVAIVLPGARYVPASPLLWFAREVALQHGWSVLEVWDELGEADDPTPWVRARLDAALESAASASDVLLVAKSLSTRAATLPAARELPGIWLTPLLVEPEIAAALAAEGGPALIIGGTGDDLWDRVAATRSRGEVITIEGGDHALHLAGDVLGSIEALSRITTGMDTFVARLSPRET
jgi:hypothetical protein